ncbi:kinase-like domain-containing protein, partial [Ganoderma leucocontextum]
LVDSDAKLVTLDVCAALAYLHAKGIVHRDIKPGNILVFSRNPLSVKVADFGIAKMIDQETYLQTMCGTPDFMAPEISRQERYDCKVDTWALGVTLFIMWVTFRHLRSDADPEIFS